MRKDKRRVVVNDRMQQGYVYFLTEPVGRDFHADFKPELTPARCWSWGCSAAST